MIIKPRWDDEFNNMEAHQNNDASYLYIQVIYIECYTAVYMCP